MVLAVYVTQVLIFNHADRLRDETPQYTPCRRLPHRTLPSTQRPHPTQHAVVVQFVWVGSRIGEGTCKGEFGQVEVRTVEELELAVFGEGGASVE